MNTIPDPASMALLATSLFALGVAGLFRRRKDEVSKGDGSEL